MNPRRVERGRWVVVLPIAIAVGVPVMAAAVLALGSSSAVLFDARLARLLANSLGVSVMATAVASVFGLAAAWTAHGVPRPVRALLLSVFTLPLLIPAYSMTAAYIDAAGPAGILSRFFESFGADVRVPSLRGLFASGWILGLHWAPVVMWSAMAGLRTLPRESVEAAALARGRRATSFGVVLPLLAPYLRTGALLVFLLTWPVYALPALLQVNTLPVESHLLFSAFDDIPGGIRLGFVQAVLGCLVAAMLVRSFAGAALAWAHDSDDPARWPLSTIPASIAVTYGLLGVALPLGALIARMESFADVTATWNNAAPEAAASLLLGTGIAFFMTGFALAAVFVSKRTASLPFALFLFAPFLMGGPPLAMGIEAVLNRPGLPGMMYDSSIVLGVASFARYFWAPYLVCITAATTLETASESYAWLSGAGAWRVFGSIFLPSMMPATVVAGVTAFVLAVQDVDTVLLIAPPGYSTLPLRVEGLMHYGPDRLVAGMSLLLIAIQILILAFGYLVFKGWSARRS